MSKFKNMRATENSTNGQFANDESNSNGKRKNVDDANKELTGVAKLARFSFEKR